MMLVMCQRFGILLANDINVFLYHLTVNLCDDTVVQESDFERASLMEVAHCLPRF